MSQVKDLLTKVTLLKAFKKNKFLNRLIIISICLSINACSIFSNQQHIQIRKNDLVSQQLEYLWDDTPAYLTYEKYSINDKKAIPLDVCQIGNKILIIDEEGNLRVDKYLISNFGKINFAKFSPNKKFVIVSKGLELYVYDTLTGEILGTLNNHKTRISQIEFSQDSKDIIFSGFDSRVYYWHIYEQFKNKEFKSDFLELYPGSSSIISTIVIKDDTYFFTGDWKGNLLLWKFYRKIKENIKNISLSRFFITDKAVLNLQNKLNNKIIASNINNDLFLLVDELGNFITWSLAGLTQSAPVNISDNTKVTLCKIYENKIIISSRLDEFSVYSFDGKINQIYHEKGKLTFAKFLSSNKIFLVNEFGQEVIVEL